MMKNILLILVLLLLMSCGHTANQAQKNGTTYFNIKGYFEQEVTRLTKANPVITKEVEVNDSLESKRIKITDWKRELSAFADADINRASWKGLFSTSKLKEQEIYKSDHEKIPVKEIAILYKGGKVRAIKIIIKNSNSLYSSIDSLSYYPDSMYQVKKSQNIKLLSNKNYQVTGKFR